MAESIENQQQNEAYSSKTHRSRSSFWIGIIIIVAVIALAGAGFYLLKELRDEQKGLGGEINKGDMQLLELSNRLTGLQEQFSVLQKQLATMQGQIASKDEQFNKTLANFSKLHEEKSDTIRHELTAAVAQVQRQLGKTRGDWLIADAEYLLSIASQRLHLTGDVETTREALLAADERLRESGDAAVFKVREELAKEIAALDKVKVPDIVGIYSTLQMLEGQADKLTVLLPYAGKEINKPQADHAQSEEAHNLLDSALVELEGLISVRHSDQAVKTILTPEQANFIKEQLKVKMEMVKISLVQQNGALYKANLADARQWLKENFTMDANAADYVAQLDKLSAITIRSQMPDVSKSLKLLRNITKLRLETDKTLPPLPTARQPLSDSQEHQAPATPPRRLPAIPEQ
ncbi:MAG: uroporphyrinogen-III C-methyltransferase [Gammaproteobacteria bacterium]